MGGGSGGGTTHAYMPSCPAAGPPRPRARARLSTLAPPSPPTPAPRRRVPLPAPQDALLRLCRHRHPGAGRAGRRRGLFRRRLAARRPQARGVARKPANPSLLGPSLISPSLCPNTSHALKKTQVFTLSLFIFALALVGAFYPYNRGALFTALILLYALTACVAGYVAASYYRQFEGEQWVPAIVLTVGIYCGPFLVAFAINNTVAIAYRVSGGGRGRCGAWGWAWGRARGPGAGAPQTAAGLPARVCLGLPTPRRTPPRPAPPRPNPAQSTAALPFGTIVILIAIWGLVTIPLTVLGGIAGKNAKAEFNAPCRRGLRGEGGRGGGVSGARPQAGAPGGGGEGRGHLRGAAAGAAIAPARAAALSAQKPGPGPDTTTPPPLSPPLSPAGPTSTPERSPSCRGTAPRRRRCAPRGGLDSSSRGPPRRGAGRRLRAAAAALPSSQAARAPPTIANPLPTTPTPPPHPPDADGGLPAVQRDLRGGAGHAGRAVRRGVGRSRPDPRGRHHRRLPSPARF
jgi:hypothetical protein